MDNIRVKNLLRLERTKIEEYVSVFKYVKPKEVIRVRWRKTATAKNLWKLSFDQVSMLRRYNSSDEVIEPICIVYGLSKKEVYNLRVSEYLPAVRWIKESLDKIAFAEQERLSSDPDPIVSQAGIEKMSIFKELNVLIPLSRKYPPLRPKDIAQWTYEDVFTELYFDKTSGDIEKAIFEIRKQQSK